MDTPTTGGHMPPRHDNAPTGGDRVGRDWDRGRQATEREHTHNRSTPSAGGVLAAPLLACLYGVRPMGAGRWMALCPAHLDRAPSLTIRDAGDRVLLHCWAGCDPDAVLAAIGLAWRDLYPDSWHCARARPNGAARNYGRRTLAAMDPLDLERRILAVAAADLRAGRVLSAEDRARIEVARDRLTAAGRGVGHG